MKWPLVNRLDVTQTHTHPNCNSNHDTLDVKSVKNQITFGNQQHWQGISVTKSRSSNVLLELEMGGPHVGTVNFMKTTTLFAMHKVNIMCSTFLYFHQSVSITVILAENTLAWNRTIVWTESRLKVRLHDIFQEIPQSVQMFPGFRSLDVTLRKMFNSQRNEEFLTRNSEKQFHFWIPSILVISYCDIDVSFSKRDEPIMLGLLDLKEWIKWDSSGTLFL